MRCMGWVMALDDLLAKLERESGTAGTAHVPPDVPPNPLQSLGGTAGTAGTAQTDKEQDVTARAWLLQFAERDPLEVWTAPPATHAEILADYPDAVAAEPVVTTIRQPSPPLSESEESAIRAWLAVIDQPDPFPDDLRTCSQCANLRQRVCTIAKPERGALVIANRGYRPDPSRLLRCEGYAPLASEADQRTGAERWPGLMQKDNE
jgi:hypothetical protein